MHQSHEETNDCKNRPGLFRVGWMHLLGILCIIFFFDLVAVYFVVRGYPMEQVLILVVVASGVANPVMWNWIDQLVEKNEAKKNQLLKQLEEQQCILKRIWRLTKNVPVGNLSSHEVQSLLSESIPVFVEQHHGQEDQIPKVERYSVLRDICEESAFWFLDKFCSLLRHGLHSIIYYFLSLFHSQRQGSADAISGPLKPFVSSFALCQASFAYIENAFEQGVFQVKEITG
jgi:hypothetical protein